MTDGHYARRKALDTASFVQALLIIGRLFAAVEAFHLFKVSNKGNTASAASMADSWPMDAFDARHIEETRRIAD